MFFQACARPRGIKAQVPAPPTVISSPILKVNLAAFDVAAPSSDAALEKRTMLSCTFPASVLHKTTGAAWRGRAIGAVGSIGSGAEYLAISCRRSAGVLLEKSCHVLLVGKPASERGLDDTGISLAQQPLLAFVCEYRWIMKAPAEPLTVNISVFHASPPMASMFHVRSWNSAQGNTTSFLMATKM